MVVSSPFSSIAWSRSKRFPWPSFLPEFLPRSGFIPSRSTDDCVEFASSRTRTCCVAHMKSFFRNNPWRIVTKRRMCRAIAAMCCLLCLVIFVFSLFSRGKWRWIQCFRSSFVPMKADLKSWWHSSIFIFVTTDQRMPSESNVFLLLHDRISSVDSVLFCSMSFERLTNLKSARIPTFFK